jgi:hypothetical protein
LSFRLRLLMRIILWFFQPKLDMNKEFSAEYRVWPTEAEISIVENARYGYLFVLERFRLIFGTQLWRVCLKNRWTAVMGASITKVKRPLKRFQKFTIITKPVCWDEKWFYFEQRIESGGKLVCSAVISVIFLAPDRKVPPQEVLGTLKIQSQSPQLSEAIKKFIEAEKTLT